MLPCYRVTVLHLSRAPEGLSSLSLCPGIISHAYLARSIYSQYRPGTPLILRLLHMSLARVVSELTFNNCHEKEGSEEENLGPRPTCYFPDDDLC